MKMVSFKHISLNTFKQQNLLKISIELCESFKVSSLNLIDSHRTATKINFLKKDIQIPDGVSDAFVSEFQNTLTYYENPLLRLEHELIDCNGSSSQYEKCLNNSTQFEVHSTFAISTSI